MNRAQKFTLAGGIVLIALVNIAIPSGGYLKGGLWTWMVLLAVVLFVYVQSLLWVYQDAKSRKKFAGLVTLAVALLAWPLGLFLWVIFRPELTRRPRRRHRRKHPESSFIKSREYSLSSSSLEK